MARSRADLCHRERSGSATHAGEQRRQRLHDLAQRFGVIVAVADSGLDADHGDFGARVLSNTDVVGDGSTADRHSGHGTHVACTVLGDGSRGGYAGVAPQAELIFQAMENDNNGQFLSPSLNYILNQAYSQGPAFTPIRGAPPKPATKASTPPLRRTSTTVPQPMTARMRIKRVSSCSLPQVMMGPEPERWVHPRPPKIRSRSATIRTATAVRRTR